MDRVPRSIAALALAMAVGAGACAAEPDPQRDGAAEVAAAGELSPERVAELKARYPVLRQEPVPEPQPGGEGSAARVPPRVREALPPRVLETVRGEATFYASHFEGRRTASGVPFRQNQLVAAHRAYPFGTLLRVTNESNQRSVNVRVVDRGPFGATAEARGTVLDLSRRAAERLDYVNAGRTRVRVEVLEWGPGLRGA